MALIDVQYTGKMKKQNKSGPTDMCEELFLIARLPMDRVLDNRLPQISQSVLQASSQLQCELLRSDYVQRNGAGLVSSYAVL